MIKDHFNKMKGQKQKSTMQRILLGIKTKMLMELEKDMIKKKMQRDLRKDLKHKRKSLHSAEHNNDPLTTQEQQITRPASNNQYQDTQTSDHHEQLYQQQNQ